MKDSAEPISDNADKIDHQREHFRMLSEDMNRQLERSAISTTF